MIYELLIELDPDRPASAGARTAQAVYTTADVEQWGSHEEYAKHILESATGQAAGLGLPEVSAPPSSAGAQATVWERDEATFVGLVERKGTPFLQWEIG